MTKDRAHLYTARDGLPDGLAGVAMRWIAAPILIGLSLAAASVDAHGRSTKAPRFGHLSACVDDAGISARFLDDTFGWKSVPGGQTPQSVTAGSVAGSDAHAPPYAPTTYWVNAAGFAIKVVSASNGVDGPCKAASYPSLTFTADDLPTARKGFASAARKLTGAVAGPGATSDRGPTAVVPEFAWPKGMTGDLDIRIAPAEAPRTTQNSNLGKVKAPRVDRLAIIVRDAEATARFFTDTLGLRRHPETIDLDGAKNPESGGIHVVFVDANGVWLALVQPVGAGPLNGYLDSYGDGVIAELIVEVPNIAAFYDQMAARNIQLVNTRGVPVDPRTKAHVLQPFLDKIAYFPAQTTGGLTIELVERGGAATSLLEHRDRGWKVVPGTQQNDATRARP